MKNLHKGFASVLIVFFVIILLGGVGFYLYSQKQKPVVPTPTEEQNDTLPKKQTPTFIYENKKYGFEIIYPKDWQPSSYAQYLAFKKNGYTVFVSYANGNNSGCGGTLQQNLKTIEIAGEKALVRPQPDLERLGPIGFLIDFPNSGSTYTCVLAHNNVVYQFNISAPNNLMNTDNKGTPYEGHYYNIDQTIITEAEQILSTFKFK